MTQPDHTALDAAVQSYEQSVATALSQAASQLAAVQAQLATAQASNTADDAQIAALTASNATLTAQVAALQAQLAAATQPPVTPPAPAQPTGQGIVCYQDLPAKGTALGSGPNGELSATINAMTTPSQVSLAPGTFDVIDFADPAAQPKYGALLGTKLLGLLGSGIDVTTIAPLPHSSTQGTQVPTQTQGGTNPLTVLRFDAANLLQGFTLQGTPQGHAYNGLELYKYPNPVVSKVKATGIPAGLNQAGVISGAPPGETFTINTFHNQLVTLSDVELDGRDSTGTVVASSLLGNNYIGGLSATRCNFHDTYNAGSTAYMCTGNFTYTDCLFTNCRVGANFEQHSNGSISLVRPVFAGNQHDMTVDSNLASVKVTIADPVLMAGQKVVVLVHQFYDYPPKPAGQPKTPNKQLQSDITLTVGGVSRPDLLTFITS